MFRDLTNFCRNDSQRKLPNFTKYLVRLTNFFMMVFMDFWVDSIQLFMQQVKLRIKVRNNFVKFVTLQWFWQSSIPSFGPKMYTFGFILAKLQKYNCQKCTLQHFDCKWLEFGQKWQLSSEIEVIGQWSELDGWC